MLDSLKPGFVDSYIGNDDLKCNISNAKSIFDEILPEYFAYAVYNIDGYYAHLDEYHMRFNPRFSSKPYSFGSKVRIQTMFNNILFKNFSYIIKTMEYLEKQICNQYPHLLGCNHFNSLRQNWNKIFVNK